MDSEKKYKILVVHNYYQIYGGEDTVVHNEIEMLRDNGHEVVFYSRHNNEIMKKTILRKAILPFETVFSLKTYNEVKKIIRKENIDIVHVHNTMPLISPSVYYAAFRYCVPVVQTLHNFRLLCPNGVLLRENRICEDCINNSLFNSVYNKCYRNSRIQTLILALNLGIHRRLGTYNKINAYIALTEFNKNKISNLICKNKIFVKPNFIKKANIKDIQINKDYTNKEYFIFVGRIEALKGIRLLIQAWKNVEYKLLVVGKGPMEDEMLSYIRDENIKNIEFLGFKNTLEVMSLIKGAKALIIPSQCYEGFPMTIVESFSLGVPVIAGQIGNLETIIQNEYNGILFQYNSSKALIDIIKKISEHKVNLQELGINSKKTFDLKYGDDENYKILINIYDSFF